MADFIVSARKYRPANFRSVIGQKSITSTLKNSIKNQQLAHAYLFCGPRGVGKTTCARIFAKTINCTRRTEEFEACDQCESCQAFNSQRSYNIHELDAASNNSVEDIRSLIEQVRIPPQIGTHSVYIIDEVHMLSVQAFNAFLKTLEEPPDYAIFVLATTEKHKILPTILSRCQIFDFNRIKVPDTVEYLQYVSGKEGITAETEALNIIAQKADGAMRDALSFFDQIVSFSGKNITYTDAIENLNVLDYEYYFKIIDAVLQSDYHALLLLFNEILDKGFDAGHFISGLSAHLRDLLVCTDKGTEKLLEVGASIQEKYHRQAQNMNLRLLIKLLEITNKTDLAYRGSPNKRLLIELALLQMCLLQEELQKKKDPAPSEAVENKEEQRQSPADNPSAGQTERRKLPTLKSSGISLKKPIKKEEHTAEQPLEITGNSEEHREITVDSLNEAWKQLVEQFTSKPRLHSALKREHPNLTEKNKAQLIVNNNSLMEILTQLKPKIVHFLKTRLHNQSFDMEIMVEEDDAQSQSTLIYTSGDKYRHLIEQNPAIEELRKEFDLEF